MLMQESSGHDTMRLSCALPAVALLVACAAFDASRAQEADFSRKTITIYIGNTAGGTYDLMGRLVARHLGRASWLQERKAKVILQNVSERGQELPDVPALGELGDTTEAKQLLGLYASTSAVGRAFFAPPGLPPAIVKTLRDGFAAMSRDPELVADANQINADLQIGSGEDVQNAVERTLNVPESVLQRAREIFAR